MRKLTGRVAVTLATAAAAVAGTFSIAQPADAAAPDSCLQQLSVKNHWYYDRVITTTGSLTFSTHEYWGSLCDGMKVSMGISRPNTRDFRNQNATKVQATSGTKSFISTYRLGRDDVGDWMIRQIAVKDRSGRLFVKTFTAQTTPRTLRARYASVLTGSPRGRLVPTAGKLTVTGSLKAWHYYGRLVNVQNQQVVVQVRRPHQSTYVTRAVAVTSRTGTFKATFATAGLKGYAVRVAYYSKIPTVANQWYYLGTIS
jgi:hypothetical protein